MNKKEEEYFNTVMNRFEEASQFHSLLNTVKLRFHNNPAAPILIKLIENERDNALELGIQEYGLFREQERSNQSGAIPSNSSTDEGN